MKLITTISSLPYSCKKLIIGNSLIQYLIKESLVGIEEIKEIVNDDTELTKKITPLNEEHKIFFKQIMKEFIALAAAGIVFVTDLQYLYDNLFNLYPHLHKPIIISKPADEKFITKSPHAEPTSLLLITSFLRRCKTNIKQRIQYILESNPVRYYHGTDTVPKIIADCKKFGIDITRDRDDQLNKILNDYYSPEKQEALDSILYQSAILGFSPLQTITKIFGERLTKIFYQIPLRVEQPNNKLAVLTNDIHITANNLNIPAITIKACVGKFLLGEIKQELINKKPLKVKIYNDIIKDISDAEKSCTDVKEEVQSDRWLSCLNKVLSYGLKKPADKLSITFFKSSYALDSQSGIKDYCEKLGAISEFVPSVNKIEHVIALSK